MKDRVSRNPGRVLVTPENGSATFYATITRADNPTVEGDAINKQNLLPDSVAQKLGLNPENNPVVADAFSRLAERIGKSAVRSFTVSEEENKITVVNTLEDGSTETIVVNFDEDGDLVNIVVDGTVIPGSWEGANSNHRLLWQNASPTSSFAAQTLTFNCPQEPKRIEIWYLLDNTASTTGTHVAELLLPASYYAIFSRSPNSSYRNLNRNVLKASWANGVMSVQFDAGYRQDTYAGTTTQVNTAIIPAKIYAYYF